MRKNEGDEVEAAFADSGVNFVRVNAGERFLSKLAGVTEPESKRFMSRSNFAAAISSRKIASASCKIRTFSGVIPPIMRIASPGPSARFTI